VYATSLAVSLQVFTTGVRSKIVPVDIYSDLPR